MLHCLYYSIFYAIPLHKRAPRQQSSVRMQQYIHVTLFCLFFIPNIISLCPATLSVDNYHRHIYMHIITRKT